MPLQLTTLYRPVGQTEMNLIRDGKFRGFPPRLPEQPIFYPVLTEDYATQIARDWNTKDERSGFMAMYYDSRYEPRFFRSTMCMSSAVPIIVNTGFPRRIWLT